MHSFPSPYFDRLGLPDGEQENALLLWSNLTQLNHHINQAQSAIQLADFCDATRQQLPAEFSWWKSEEDSKLISWKFIAAQALAICVYNYAEMKQAIEKVLGKCPSIREHVDRNALSEANKLFDATFPGYAHLRLGVAHSGKLASSIEKADQHTVPGTGVTIRNGLDGRIFYSSINGKMATLDTTQASVDALIHITLLIYHGYEPASAIVCEKGRKVREEMYGQPGQG